MTYAVRAVLLLACVAACGDNTRPAPVPGVFGARARDEVCPTDDTGDTETSTSELRELRFTPAIQLPVFPISEYVDDFNPDGFDKTTLVRVKAADNEGSRLTGMAAQADGTVRVIVNMSDRVDDGILILQHESGRSAEENRFRTPNEDDFYLPKNGAVTVIYDASVARWIVIAPGGRFSRVTTQALGFFTNVTTQPLSGTYNDWAPTDLYAQSTPYASGLGAGGNSLAFRDNSVFQVPVDAAGATLTGMEALDNAFPGGHDQLKILINYGPGDLTLAHRSAASSTFAQFDLPGEKDLVVPYLATVVLLHSSTSWKVVATTATTRDVSLREVKMQRAVLSSITPGVLDGGGAITHDWIPDGFLDAPRIRAQAGSGGSVLTGMAGSQDGVLVGTIKILTNWSPSQLTLRSQDPSSAPDRRLILNGLPPAPDIVLDYGDSVTFEYDEQLNWHVIATAL